MDEVDDEEDFGVMDDDDDSSAGSWEALQHSASDPQLAPASTLLLAPSPERVMTRTPSVGELAALGDFNEAPTADVTRSPQDLSMDFSDGGVGSLSQDGSRTPEREVDFNEIPMAGAFTGSREDLSTDRPASSPVDNLMYSAPPIAVMDPVIAAVPSADDGRITESHETPRPGFVLPVQRSSAGGHGVIAMPEPGSLAPKPVPQVEVRGARQGKNKAKAKTRQRAQADAALPPGQLLAECPLVDSVVNLLQGWVAERAGQADACLPNEEELKGLLRRIQRRARCTRQQLNAWFIDENVRRQNAAVLAGRASGVPYQPPEAVQYQQAPLLPLPNAGASKKRERYAEGGAVGGAGRSSPRSSGANSPRHTYGPLAGPPSSDEEPNVSPRGQRSPAASKRLASSPGGSPREGKLYPSGYQFLPTFAVQVMTEWWNLHHDSPYPTRPEKEEMLARIQEQSSFTVTQLENWFINVRQRHWRAKQKNSDREGGPAPKITMSPGGSGGESPGGDSKRRRASQNQLNATAGLELPGSPRMSPTPSPAAVPAFAEGMPTQDDGRIDVGMPRFDATRAFVPGLHQPICTPSKGEDDSEDEAALAAQGFGGTTEKLRWRTAEAVAFDDGRDAVRREEKRNDAAKKRAMRFARRNDNLLPEELLELEAAAAPRDLELATAAPKLAAVAPIPRVRKAAASAAAASSSKAGAQDPMRKRVTMWDRKRKIRIMGNAAPLAMNVEDFLRKHTDCEIYVRPESEVDAPRERNRNRKRSRRAGSRPSSRPGSLPKNVNGEAVLSTSPASDMSSPDPSAEEQASPQVTSTAVETAVATATKPVASSAKPRVAATATTVKPIVKATVTANPIVAIATAKTAFTVTTPKVAAGGVAKQVVVKAASASTSASSGASSSSAAGAEESSAEKVVTAKKAYIATPGPTESSPARAQPAAMAVEIPQAHVQARVHAQVAAPQQTETKTVATLGVPPAPATARPVAMETEAARSSLSPPKLVQTAQPPAQAAQQQQQQQQQQVDPAAAAKAAATAAELKMQLGAPGSPKLKPPPESLPAAASPGKKPRASPKRRKESDDAGAGYTDDELRALIEGVRKYGLGRWEQLFRDAELQPRWAAGRKPHKLADKWKNLVGKPASKTQLTVAAKEVDDSLRANPQWRKATKEDIKKPMLGFGVEILWDAKDAVGDADGEIVGPQPKGWVTAEVRGYNGMTEQHLLEFSFGHRHWETLKSSTSRVLLGESHAAAYAQASELLGTEVDIVQRSDGSSARLRVHGFSQVSGCHLVRGAEFVGSWQVLQGPGCTAVDVRPVASSDSSKSYWNLPTTDSGKRVKLEAPMSAKLASSCGAWKAQHPSEFPDRPNKELLATDCGVPVSRIELWFWSHNSSSDSKSKKAAAAKEKDKAAAPAPAPTERESAASALADALKSDLRASNPGQHAFSKEEPSSPGGAIGAIGGVGGDGYKAVPTDDFGRFESLINDLEGNLILPASPAATSPSDCTSESSDNSGSDDNALLGGGPARYSPLERPGAEPTSNALTNDLM